MVCTIVCDYVPRNYTSICQKVPNKLSINNVTSI